MHLAIFRVSGWLIYLSTILIFFSMQKLCSSIENKETKPYFKTKRANILNQIVKVQARQ